MRDGYHMANGLHGYSQVGDPRPIHISGIGVQDPFGPTCRSTPTLRNFEILGACVVASPSSMTPGQRAFRAAYEGKDWDFLTKDEQSTWETAARMVEG